MSDHAPDRAGTDGAARRRLRIAQPRSLQSRQLWAASLGLVAFLALAGYALDFAFQSTARSGMRERLHSYALAYANSDFARDGSVVPPWDPPDARFKRPGSGLYAQIVLPSGRWESGCSPRRASKRRGPS